MTWERNLTPVIRRTEIGIRHYSQAPKCYCQVFGLLSHLTLATCDILKLFKSQVWSMFSHKYMHSFNFYTNITYTSATPKDTKTK